MTQSEVRNEPTTNEKLDDLEELGRKQSESSPPCSESDPMDRGRRAWATAFGCFLVQFCGYGYINSFGVYQDFYTRIYLTNQAPSTISWIGALTSFLAANTTLISGLLYDRGWFYQLMIVGSSLQSLSLFMLSFAKPGQFYFVFMIQGVLSGIGMGLMYGPSMAVISQHFSKRRTLVMSFVASGTPLGAIVHPMMLNHLFHGTVGFTGGVRVSAGFVSALLLIACLSMRTRALTTSKPTASYSVVARKCSREVPFILMTAGITLCQIGFFYPVFYLQLDSIKHGVDVHFSFYSLVILNAAAVIGRCTAGIIASYTGLLNLTIASTFACGALIISMIALSQMSGVIVIAVTYGYVSGVFVSMSVPLVTMLTPNLSELGVRMGFCFGFTAFGSALSGPVSGALLSSQYRWLIPSLFCGIICFVASLIFVVMRLIIYRQR
ncbi:major facilitator superfamily domain-containing protein [Suillus clintonianus]|uniref:major facilitator superfamily domain-containing protein n=1 Tax=Suillus clintonianus TaxID=1904413 RepID=UPI001B85E2B3|nr:major facilitator superfamily domain-containing protein [Suillus clintonianus]KAG2133316.1 major facilitator superfamily domain-containing protein [Suillus clintonianus]